jgi:asparaginyl-tRNA synthetase
VDEERECIMPPWVTIRDIAAHEGREVTLKGWLYNYRKGGKLRFLQIRDGTGIIQCVVFKGDVDEDTFEDAKRLVQEASLEVTGIVKRDERSPIGFELGVTGLTIVHLPTEEYPISPKEHGTGFLMDHRHLWLRSRRQHAVLSIRALVIRAIRDYFDREGFTLVDTPIFTPAACEGTTTLFSTRYFDETAYLTQSGQLYNEATIMAFGKTYCFGPTFRAEKSKTRRHLIEFWMVEPEMAFYDLDMNMSLAEDFLTYVVARVLDEGGEHLKVLERDTAPLERVQKPFPRVHYDEAMRILRDHGSDIADEDDFGGADETLLTEQFDTPIVVHRFPTAVKAFYMKRDPEDQTRCLSMDVLASEGYGEIIGGGQREEDIETLLHAIHDHGLPEEAFQWYLDLRRYGSVPHSGFGLGVERTVSWICGL